MSTKIYNGYRLAEGVDLFAFSRELREKMDLVFNDYVLGRVIALAGARKRKPETFKGHSRAFCKGTSLMSLWGYFDEVDEQMYRRLTDFEVGFTSDPQTGRVLAVLFTDNEEFRAAWEALPGVESFPYWNNTDRPDYLSEEEWEERREVWDRAIGYRPLIEEMLMFHLHGEGSRWPMAYLTADPEGRRAMVERLLPEDFPLSLDELEF